MSCKIMPHTIIGDMYSQIYIILTTLTNFLGAPDKPCGEDARMLTQKLLLNDT